MLRREFIKTAASVPICNSTIGGISEAAGDPIEQRIVDLQNALCISRGGNWVIRTDDKGDFILLARR